MPTVTRTFDVVPAPEVVLAYLTDFANAVHWDPGTESCERLDDGPVQPGARWHNVSKIAGISTELTYTLQSVSADTVVFVGRNDTATSTDTIQVVPDHGGSRLTYTAEIEMNGIAKLATPAIKIVFEKLGNDTERQLTEVLNGLG